MGGGPTICASAFSLRAFLCWLLAVWTLVASAICCGGCAGKNGTNHPSGDDWSAFKDAYGFGHGTNGAVKSEIRNPKSEGELKSEIR